MSFKYAALALSGAQSKVLTVGNLDPVSAPAVAKRQEFPISDGAEDSRRGVAESSAVPAPDRAAKNAALALLDAYTEDTRLFVRFLDERGLALDYDGVARYAAWLRERGFAAATINKRLAGAKNRLRLIFRDSPEALDVLSRFKLETALKELRGQRLASRQVDLHKVLSAGQVRKLVSSQKVPQRARLFMEFMATTGVRVSELCRIRIADVATDHGVCMVRIHGKGQKERRVKVWRELIDRARACFHGREYLFESRGRSYTRQYVSHCTRLAGELVLQRKISAHTLRHTFATLEIRRTNKLKGVSLYLGHSSTAITADMYLHEELTLEDLVVDSRRRPRAARRRGDAPMTAGENAAPVAGLRPKTEQSGCRRSRQGGSKSLESSDRRRGASLARAMSKLR